MNIFSDDPIIEYKKKKRVVKIISLLSFPDKALIMLDEECKTAMRETISDFFEKEDKTNKILDIKRYPWSKKIREKYEELFGSQCGC